jgi:uncharacterized repeat protein (TIGR01451 family)
MVRHLFKKTLNTKAFLSFAAVVCLNILISPELGAVTVTASINSSTDDAEQRVNSGTLVTNSTDLEINYEDGEPQLVGLLFDNIDIAQGTVICSNSYLEFQADESNSEVTTIDFYGQDIDDAPNLGNGNGNISDRTLTTARVIWSNVPAWTTGNTYQTPSIQTIIQEIIDRPGWSNNNEMVMIVSGQGGSRVAESHNGNAGAAPILHIEYDSGSGCGSPATETTQINNNNDDAEENMATTVIDRGSSDLELVHEGGTSQLIGLRFNAVNVPADATVNSASIRFTTDETDVDATSTTIYGQLNATPLTFSSGNNISSRLRTTASTAWNNIPSWSTVGESGANQTTPDLAALVQEIVSLGGWSSGNSVTFILEGWGERTAEAFDGSPANAPLLTIDYTVSVPGEANISINKTDSIDPVPINTNFNYSLVVNNNGPLDATAVMLTDVLPSALSFVSVFTSQGTCSEASGAVSCTLGDIPNGSNATVTIFVDSPATSQIINNTAFISASSPDSLSSDNSDTEGTTIGGNTDQLCYIFSDANNSLSLYDTALGTVTDYASNGTSVIEAIAWDSENSVLYGADAGQLGILSQSDGSWTPIGSGFGTANGSLGAVNLSDVDGMAFDANAGANVMYGVHEGVGQDVIFQINLATGTFISGAFGGEDYIPLTVINGNNITDDIAIDPTTGQMYAAVNNGGSTDRLIRIDKTNGGATDIALISINDTEGLGSDPSGQLWGTSGTLNTVFEIDKFTGQGSDPRALNFGDNEAVDCIGVSPTVSADLAVTKVVSNATPGSGDTITYTVNLSNNGGADATAIQVQDLLPAEITFVSAAPAQGSYDNLTGYWFAGSLASGVSIDLIITGSVAGELGTLVTNTASISSASQPDAVTANNSFSVELTISQPNLQIVKTASPTLVSPGGLVTYTITVTNVGNALATNVELDDELGVFTDFGFHSYGDTMHFDFVDGAIPSGLATGAISFDDGTDTFAYVPPAGPAQVFDGTVTDWKIIMVGSMNGDNASFSIEYEVVVQ